MRGVCTPSRWCGYDARQLLATQAAATATRAQRAVKPHRVGGGVNFTSAGGGMDAEIDVPSFESYMNLKQKVKSLEKRIMAKNDTICRLRKRLKEKPRADKGKLIELLLSGITAEAAAPLSNCSRSTADRMMRQLKDAGVIAEREVKKSKVIWMIQQGFSDSEISRQLHLCNGYVRNVRVENKNAIRNT